MSQSGDINNVQSFMEACQKVYDDLFAEQDRLVESVLNDVSKINLAEQLKQQTGSNAEAQTGSNTAEKRPFKSYLTSYLSAPNRTEFIQQKSIEYAGSINVAFMGGLVTGFLEDIVGLIGVDELLAISEKRDIREQKKIDEQDKIDAEIAATKVKPKERVMVIEEDICFSDTDLFKQGAVKIPGTDCAIVGIESEYAQDWMLRCKFLVKVEEAVLPTFLRGYHTPKDIMEYITVTEMENFLGLEIVSRRGEQVSDAMKAIYIIKRLIHENKRPAK